ncbi:MAG TPA: VWA domain-containing protein [Pyrinomonadaceae bacterium]|nr:VWA domain-containing protein [Pyrinomonadaceae bacterium]
MKSYIFSLSLVFLAVLSAGAQTPHTVPSPTPADDDVVKISTNLIQVDVSVTDGSGKPVTDLKPEEVEIYENGEKQKIANFSFVSNVRTTIEQPKNTGAGGIVVPVPPRTVRPEQIHRTFALVVDDLSLSFESAYSTRRALKKFVDEQMQDGDLVAIIRTGAGIGALQQFTSDKRLLYAAIEKVKWNPSGTGGVSAFAPIEATPETDPTPDPNSDEATSMTGSGQSLDSFRGTVFATGTLGALKYIVTGMSQLPGRKSVIMFSDGFKLFETDDNGNPVSSQVLDFLRTLVDLANRSAVTFYTVDARGLQTLGFTAADNISDTSPDAMNAQRQARSDQLHDTQEGLTYLAEETGGFAIRDNNDLSGGVRRVLDDQSYYLVGYEPDADTFDPAKRKFNKLEVRVLRKGVKVRYRSGFFNVAETERPASAPTTRTPSQQLEDALVSPFAVRGIDLRLNALFGDDPKSGAFVRSLLHVNTADLVFTDEKDGTKKTTIEILAMSFGDNGKIVDQLAKGYTITLKPEQYKRLAASGFVYQFTFPVKKPGAYQYRVALRDATGGGIGSANQFIEVPDVKNNRLTTSSMILHNLTAEEWQGFNSGASSGVATNSIASDTALRQVLTNSVLRYGLEIYNANLDAEKQPHLTTRVRVFRDGKLFYEGKDVPMSSAGQTDLRHLKTAGALAIGKTMHAGDYVLQIVVTDTLAKAKQQIATQFVEFEVVQ